MEATKLQDCSQIVKSFQKKMLAAPNEESVIGGMLSSVSMMQVNATSAAANIENACAPPIPETILKAIQNTDEGVSVELPIDLSGVGGNNKLITLGLEWLERCVPCTLRVKFRADLALSLSDTILNTQEQMLANFIDQLNFVMNLLGSSDVYQDACLILNAMQDICIPDIQRIISLFSASLYRQTSKEILSIDIMKLLIQPIFQPIFSSITQLFGQYKVMVTDPLHCVVTQLDTTLEKIKTGGFLDSTTIQSIEDRTNDLIAIADINGIAPSAADFSAADVTQALNNAQTAGLDYDETIQQMQNGLGSSLFHLKRLVVTGITEVESLVDEMESELLKFVGGGQAETTAFLMAQYDKLLLVRMIAFLSATVKALASGFDCGIPNAEVGANVLTQFFDQYLGPQSPVVVQVDPVTGEALLALEVAPTQSLVVDPTGNNEVDQAVSAIIEQATTPVSVRPKCFFEAQTPDDNKLAAILAELDTQEV